MTHFTRRGAPVVVSSGGIPDGCREHFLWRDVVQRRELDRYIVATDLLDIPTRETANAAATTEEMAANLVAELVVVQDLRAGQ